jgi:hypothetical protein
MRDCDIAPADAIVVDDDSIHQQQVVESGQYEVLLEGISSLT